MKRIPVVTLLIVLLPLMSAMAQDSTVHVHGLAGYHIGVVQPIVIFQQGETHFLNESDYYAIGFPIGITFHTSGKAMFDLELVPLINPYVNQSKPYNVHLLVHPGILVPLGSGFTFGFRLAFETGAGQFGFTPLLNKTIAKGPHHSFFIELVAPGRFGPDKNSGYTQILGLHAGFGF